MVMIRQRPPGWILSLAHQTLAAILARRSDFDESVRLLRRGVDALPDDQRLRLLLAYHL